MVENYRLSDDMFLILLIQKIYSLLFFFIITIYSCNFSMIRENHSVEVERITLGKNNIITNTKIVHALISALMKNLLERL